MHYFKIIGSKENLAELWENRESLEKYLAILEESMNEYPPSKTDETAFPDYTETA